MRVRVTAISHTLKIEQRIDRSSAFGCGIPAQALASKGELAREIPNTAGVALNHPSRCGTVRLSFA
jgi:hypothetical protein